MDNSPAHLALVNSLVVTLKRQAGLADTAVANPSVYTSGPFGILVMKRTDGTILFEAHSDALLYGGRVAVPEASLPVTYDKFVKYGDETGNRLMRVCYGAAGGVRIVIGKHLERGAPTKFSKIVAEIELAPVSDIDSLIMRHHWKLAADHRRFMAKVRADITQLPPELRAMFSESA